MSISSYFLCDNTKLGEGLCHFRTIFNRHSGTLPLSLSWPTNLSTAPAEYCSYSAVSGSSSAFHDDLASLVFFQKLCGAPGFTTLSRVHWFFVL